MRLGLSKKGDPRGRHLVLATDRADGFAIYPAVCEKVLDGYAEVREFDPATNTFRYRFHMRYLNRLLLVFPYVELSPALDKYVVQQQKKEMEKLPVPDIEIPGFYDYKFEEPASPFDFQRVGMDRIERWIASVTADQLTELRDAAIEIAEMFVGKEQAAFFLNDEVGLGKTIMGMGVLVRNRWFPAICVTPNSGKWSTKRIIDRFFDDDFTYQVVDGTRAERASQLYSGADLTIVNWETIRVNRSYDKHTRVWSETVQNPEVFSWGPEHDRVYEFAIIDEYHRARNHETQVAAGFLKLQAKRWLMMSGTPFLNRIQEVWTALHKVDPMKFPTFYHFEKELLIKDSGRTIGYEPEKVVELKAYIAARSIRRRRDHVSDQLPEVVYVQRDVILTPEQRRLYNLIVEELILEFADTSKKKIVNPLSRMIRLKQACFSPELYGGSTNSAKIDEMRTDVEQLVASGEKAIMFSQWSRATRILEREFAAYNPAYVDGTVKGKHRSAQEDRFNEDDDVKLYIGTIGANREAITLNAATYVLFSDKEWTPMANSQAAGRSAAGGLRGLGVPPGTKVHIIEYQAKGTIEQWIESVLGKKQRSFDRFMERDGGVRYPKVTTMDIKQLLRRVT